MSTLIAHGFVEQHGAHLGVILVPTLLMLAVALGAELRAWRRQRKLTTRATMSRPGSVRMAAHLAVLAGLIHLAVGPAHFEQAVLYGGFFVVVAFAQVAWAMAIAARPRSWVIHFGIVGNALVIGLWLVTRTIGVPLGPDAGQVEAVGALDIVTTLLEIGIIVSCVRSIRLRERRQLLPV